MSGAVGAVNGVTVTYRLGGTTRSDHFPYALIMCVEPGPCDGLDTGDVLRSLGLLPARA